MKELRRKLMLTAAVISLLLPAGCGKSVQPTEMSVILVTLDTTRADHIGIYGDSPVRTPNLDRMAAGGTVFDAAYSQVPLTLPAHSTIFTGLYPATHGVRHNGIYHLPEGVTTLAETMADSGFETAGFVAAYVMNRGFGAEQGFETYDDIPVDRYAGGHDQLYAAERTAAEINEKIFRWLEQPHDRRIFLWVHYYDPHEPYSPPEDRQDLEGEGYAREISYMDACFGDLVSRLEQDGWLDKSLLVVVGDHGESLGEHGETTHGIFLYEGPMRVPLFMRAPGLVPAGGRLEAVTGLVDIAPTVLDLLDMPAVPAMQGESLEPAILGKGTAPGGPAYAESLMPRLEFGWSELYMAVDEKYKYIKAPAPELYDLENDPEELNNIVSEFPDRAARMAADLEEWLGRIENVPSPGQAAREIGAEELERLQTLGYLEQLDPQDGTDRPGEADRLDPKDVIQEVNDLDAARLKLRQGDAGAALRGVERILRVNPRNHWAHLTRIDALIELGRLEDAETAAAGYLESAAAESSPGEILEQVTLLLAATNHMLGRNDAAEELYLAVLDGNPASEIAAVDLARMLVDTGRPQEALDLADGVISRNPRNGMALAARFHALLSLGERDAAMDTAAELARARAGDPDTLVLAGDMLQQAGRQMAAAACFETAQEQVDPDPVLLGKIGVAYLETGRMEDAVTVFRAATEIGTRDPRPPFYLGRIALRSGDEEGARRWFELALKRNPRFSEPRLYLARWLAEQGRIDEARSQVLDALRANPSDSRARQLLTELSGSP